MIRNLDSIGKNQVYRGIEGIECPKQTSVEYNAFPPVVTEYTELPPVFRRGQLQTSNNAHDNSICGTPYPNSFYESITLITAVGRAYVSLADYVCDGFHRCRVTFARAKKRDQARRNSTRGRRIRLASAVIETGEKKRKAGSRFNASVRAICSSRVASQDFSVDDLFISRLV